MYFYHQYDVSKIILRLIDNKAVAAYLISSLLFSSCKYDNVLVDENNYTLDIPAGFNYPVIPDDNILTEEKINLGKELFYDPILSVDSTISCSSCHKPEWAFSDHEAISSGVNSAKGFRNAPSLTNVAYVPVMLRDGGNPSLETQIEVPVETDFEMNFNMVLLSEKLNNNSYYKNAFQKVFGTAPEPFGITRAIASFERTLISGNSPYDKYTFQNDKTAMNDSQVRGMNLFFSNRLNCSSCHNSFTFTNNTFQNNGLYIEYFADSGRARITHNGSDVGKFKVPTLRNIAITYPYMHDGSMQTLSEVIDFYQTGGQPHPNKSELIKSFTLTTQEKDDLINFLNALTDEQFINNPQFKE